MYFTQIHSIHCLLNQNDLRQKGFFKDKLKQNQIPQGYLCSRQQSTIIQPCRKISPYINYYRGLSETLMSENYTLMKEATMNNNCVKQNARGAKIVV